MLIFNNNNGHSYVITEDRGRKGLESESGVILLPPVCDSIEELESYYGLGEKKYVYKIGKNGKYGLVQACNLELDNLLSIKYDDIIHVETNRFLYVIVKEKGKYGLYCDDCWLFIPIYDSINVITYNDKDMESHQYLTIEENGKYGVLFIPDVMNECEIEFEEVLPPVNDLGVRVKKEGVWGYLNRQRQFTADLSQVPME